MVKFRYKAVTSTGELVEGEIDAATRQAVVTWLHEQGQTPIRAHELSDRAGRAFATRFRIGTDRVPDAAVTLATRQLATLLRAGLPIDRALALLDDSEEEPRRRRFITHLLDSVRTGMSLSEALLQHKESLPPYYIGLVRAGEAGGTLDTVLLRLADVLERSQSLKESVRSAMYYPLFVLAMSALTLTVLLTVVVPEFRPLFDQGAQIPATMAVVLAVSDVIRELGLAIVLSIVLIIWLLHYQLNRPAGRLLRDRWVLAMPLLGYYCYEDRSSSFRTDVWDFVGERRCHAQCTHDYRRHHWQPGDRVSDRWNRKPAKARRRVGGAADGVRRVSPDGG